MLLVNVFVTLRQSDSSVDGKNCELLSWIDNSIKSDSRWRSLTKKLVWASFSTDQKSFTGHMFNIKLQEKSNEISFKALPVKIQPSKSDRRRGDKLCTSEQIGWTQFSPMFRFYTPWKHQKTFSRGMQMEHWANMG